MTIHHFSPPGSLPGELRVPWDRSANHKRKASLYVYTVIYMPIFWVFCRQLDRTNQQHPVVILRCILFGIPNFWITFSARFGIMHISHDHRQLLHKLYLNNKRVDWRLSSNVCVPHTCMSCHYEYVMEYMDFPPRLVVFTPALNLLCLGRFLAVTTLTSGVFWSLPLGSKSGTCEMCNKGD